MNEATTVPIEWLFLLGGGLTVTLVGAFTWWLRAEWARNWDEHLSMRSAAHDAHAELDQRIDNHHKKIDQHLDRIHNRIDYLIRQRDIPFNNSKEG